MFKFMLPLLLLTVRDVTWVSWGNEDEYTQENAGLHVQKVKNNMLAFACRSANDVFTFHVNIVHNRSIVRRHC